MASIVGCDVFNSNTTCDSRFENRVLEVRAMSDNARYTHHVIIDIAN